MRTALFWSAIVASFLIGEVAAYRTAELGRVLSPAPVECQQPPEVSRMAALMAAMPLDVTVTAIGSPPEPTRARRAPARDQIAELIGGL